MWALSIIYILKAVYISKNALMFKLTYVFYNNQKFLLYWETLTTM